jgi:hypothetical protein
MVYFMEILFKWMVTGGTPILGNLHDYGKSFYKSMIVMGYPHDYGEGPISVQELSEEGIISYGKAPKYHA